MTDIEVIDWMLEDEHFGDRVDVFDDTIQVSITMETRNKDWYEKIVKTLGNRDYYVDGNIFVVQR